MSVLAEAALLDSSRVSEGAPTLRTIDVPFYPVNHRIGITTATAAMMLHAVCGPKTARVEDDKVWRALTGVYADSNAATTYARALLSMHQIALDTSLISPIDLSGFAENGPS